MKFTTATLAIAFFGDTSALFTAFDRFAEQMEGDEEVANHVPSLCHALLDCSPLMHSVSNAGNVWRTEGEALAEMNAAYEDAASRYAEVEQASEEQFKSNWLVVTLNFCYERLRSFDAIECSINTLEGVEEALKELALLCLEDGCLRAFDLHWSPATPQDNLTDDQVIEYYPELLPL